MPASSITTIKDWTISTVTFEQGATLINNPTGLTTNNPSGKTMAGTLTMSAIAFNTPTLTSGSLFLFAGTYTYAPTTTGEYGFNIDNIDINNGALAGSSNMFISLTGSFIGLKVNDVLLNNVTCDAMSLVYLAPT
jgi:hypothetical protein